MKQAAQTRGRVASAVSKYQQARNLGYRGVVLERAGRTGRDPAEVAREFDAELAESPAVREMLDNFALSKISSEDRRAIASVATRGQKAAEAGLDEARRFNPDADLDPTLASEFADATLADDCTGAARTAARRHVAQHDPEGFMDNATEAEVDAELRKAALAAGKGWRVQEVDPNEHLSDAELEQELQKAAGGKRSEAEVSTPHDVYVD